jgi:hypothetical protein
VLEATGQAFTDLKADRAQHQVFQGAHPLGEECAV